jgi:hypothetical protein
MKNYANAKNVLPEKLFKEVRKHYTGLLYIPDEPHREQRRKLVMQLFHQGAPSNEIAVIVGLGVRRVAQIMKEERDKMRPEGAPATRVMGRRMRRRKPQVASEGR